MPTFTLEATDINKAVFNDSEAAHAFLDKLQSIIYSLEVELGCYSCHAYEHYLPLVGQKGLHVNTPRLLNNQVELRCPAKAWADQTAGVKASCTGKTIEIQY